MAKQEKLTSGIAGVQVFELTMDNPESQDELNRQLQKSGEPNNRPSAMIGRDLQDESTTESAKKNDGVRKSSRTNGPS